MTVQATERLPEGGKARRVYLALRDELSRGTYRINTLLPAENRLAESFEVSRITIRRALDALAHEGWIEKKTGAGSLVLPRATDNNRIAADFATLIPQLAEIGSRTTARLIAFSYGVAPQPIAEALDLAPDTRVQTAIRVRSHADEPYSYLTSHVPEQIARNYNEADLATQPLFKLLERSGVKLGNAHQSVSATLAAPEVASELNISVGAPLLYLRRTVRDQNGRGVEHLTALYRPDLFHLEMNLAMTGNGEERHWKPVIGATR